MKTLLFGKDGQVGRELQRSLRPMGELIALGRDATNELAGDFLRPDNVMATVRTVHPELVVIAAAYTDVDAAEREPMLASLINAEVPAGIARAAHACGARVVYYSTEHVFDGTGIRAWTEDDVPSPVNAYGRTKLEGERQVARHCPQHLIVRTSWIHSARRSNFVRRVLEQALGAQPVNVVDDQVGAPTPAALVADITAQMVRGWTSEPLRSGIYHAAAAGEASRYDCARQVVAEAAASGLLDTSSEALVKPVSSSAWPSAARRPANSRLDTSRLRHVFGVALPPWQDGVAETVREFARLRAGSVRPGGSR